MRNVLKHYINGEWINSTGNETTEVINPANKEVIGKISLGTEEDLDKAVQAAREAFSSYSTTTREQRIDLLEKIAAEYENRKEELIETITEELGSPITKSEEIHYQMGYNHFKQAAEELKQFQFMEEREDSTIMKESIGVSGLITPWNFPTNQTTTKIASALAAGSPMVLKPAEITPFAAIILAEIFDKVGVPKGVFNLVNGTGSTIGNGISSHPDIDFVSFTGSVGVGQKTMENGAKNIKKIALELGGKSPLIVLNDTDPEYAANTAVTHMLTNTGQVCTAATRIIVPKEMKSDFEKALLRVLPNYKVGDPQDEDTFTGPLVAEKIWDRVQEYIQKGIDEGATLLTGGTGNPEGLDKGYYAKPTIFTDVDNKKMTIAREEIFGPVLAVIYVDSLDEAIEVANDTPYGLAGYVIGKDKNRLTKAAQHIRAGRVTINNAEGDFSAPFGGFKQSGIGREWGDYGIDEYLEPKTILGMK
ncbi:aldehyde dehydrogenase family protein [Virgibacillus halodenitrificans]|uniref:aldehyde dehydrogenase (NAD(+)) n=1 Tax=Virgibacillus halodenitrificans TaxID=1482 RepID=A0ABR7VRT4_VIRHA|nr:aldehyde dehydrogenase family protein [Virgibacillus halodenitrificans]MBD1224061.1 aldehyde dehydrogenase family protein [Virgibacillus halodenitrificans]MCG1029094.1 aldehyde dehydrogenase family protein [Virgibacillus halodenitrificans]MEC2160089.1 aldehyde dehydrogenase family protein [Virgibacillus halodenitrificans]MYL58801.1 aldehyde dehydrogenase family protein [Virgibacillus halodenitrificans]CDQ35289.1 Putative aldehyde dehydrogenase [Virgibacillus halodenitrificans]